MGSKSGFALPGKGFLIFLSFDWRGRTLKKFIALAFFFVSPVASIAGFPEGKNGYDLEKLEKSFRLPCDEIGNDDCIARVFGVGACTWTFGIKMGKSQVIL